MNRLYAVCTVMIMVAVLGSFLSCRGRVLQLRRPDKSVAQGSTELAVDLYRELGQKQQGNLFFSPLSISTALAMTYAGARDETPLVQMKENPSFSTGAVGAEFRLSEPRPEAGPWLLKSRTRKSTIANAACPYGGQGKRHLPENSENILQCGDLQGRPRRDQRMGQA